MSTWSRCSNLGESEFTKYQKSRANQHRDALKVDDEYWARREISASQYIRMLVLRASDTKQCRQVTLAIRVRDSLENANPRFQPRYIELIDQSRLAVTLNYYVSECNSSCLRSTYIVMANHILLVWNIKMISPIKIDCIDHLSSNRLAHVAEKKQNTLHYIVKSVRRFVINILNISTNHWSTINLQFGPYGNVEKKGERQKALS